MYIIYTKKKYSKNIKRAVSLSLIWSKNKSIKSVRAVAMDKYCN